MKRAFLAHVEAGGDGVAPIVLEAVARHPEMLQIVLRAAA